MIFRNKKILSIFLSLALVLGVVFGGISNQAFAEENQKIVIVHINDNHGRLAADSREGGMGVGILKTKLDELRAEYPNLVVVNAGDSFHGTTTVNLTEGEAMVKVMNLLGFEVMVPGNHDFNYGYDRLLELKEMADFDIVAANVVKEEDTRDFDAYVIKDFDGFKVGFIGLATPETKFKSHPNNTIGVEFENPVDVAKKAVAELKELEVDFIVALVHLGIEGTVDVTSKEVAEKVEGIDLVIDGHSHEELNLLFGDVLLVQAGNYLDNLGLVEIEIADGKVVKLEGKLIGAEEVADLEADEEVEALIKEVEEENKAFLDVVVGTTNEEIYGGRNDESSVRRNETPLGNLIADVMRKSTGADVAFANGGGIRSSLPEGEVKVDDIVKAFPFTNTLAVIEVTGAELLAGVEHGVELYPEEAGWFPQVSGMTFKFDPNKAKGEKVLEVLVGGQPLDVNAKYNLVTNDFMASGGDDYTMFSGKDFIAEGGLLSDVLIEYFKEVGQVEAEVEGRITNLPYVAPEPEPEPSVEQKYTVVAGDVLWRIAQKFGTTWEKLAEYNKLKNPNLIMPGQVILVP